MAPATATRPRDLDATGNVVPLLKVEWIAEPEHATGVAAVLATARKKLSLVDCVSFQIMRRRGVRSAFCFDSHFREQGFDVLH